MSNDPVARACPLLLNYGEAAFGTPQPRDSATTAPACSSTTRTAPGQRLDRNTRRQSGGRGGEARGSRCATPEPQCIDGVRPTLVRPYRRGGMAQATRQRGAAEGGEWRL